MSIVLKGGGMSTKFRFLLTAIAFLSTGCAAPMTKVVATRQSETIDQNLFKEGDEVWITYQDSMDTVKTKRGLVLDMDDDSVRLIEYRQAPSPSVKDRWDAGLKRFIDIEYRQVHTLSHPVKDLRFLGISAGSFLVLSGDGDGLPDIDHFVALGASSRHAPYSNAALETSFSVGKRTTYSGPDPLIWFLAMNFHGQTIIPRTYFFLGMGWAWSRGWTREFPRQFLPIPSRLGFGVTKHNKIKGFNVRIEAEVGALIGIRTYFERKRR